MGRAETPRLSRVPWLVLALFAAAPAHAELYRWIDPESGSVKFSSLPPPAGVHSEIVPFAGRPRAVTEQPKSPTAGRGTDLESRWRELLGTLLRADLRRMDEPLRQQLQLFQAMGSELDRIDPAGTERRRAEQAPLVDRLRQAAAQ